MARAPAVRTIRGATCQLRACMSCSKGVYLLILREMASMGKRSLQKVNSINWIMIEDVGVVGGGC
jgi:hypothetical protein